MAAEVKPTGRLVCNVVAQGNGGIEAQIRDCRQCAALIWVSNEMVPLVDTGELHTICEPCFDKELGAVVDAIHPQQFDGLVRYGLLEVASKYIAEQRQKRRRGTK